MDNYIIKGCGTIDEIIVALNTAKRRFAKLDARRDICESVKRSGNRLTMTNK